MRWLVLASLAACGGAAAPAPRAPEPGPPGPRTRADDPPAVDPIAALSSDLDGEQVAWLVPGRAQLELGGLAIDPPGGDRPIEVGMIERQGTLVRAAVRLDHARFSLWTDRERLFAQLVADRQLETPPGSPADVHVALRAGARVRRLAHKDGATRVRFVGALEVEGWVPDKLLADSGPRRDRPGRFPSGRRPLHVMPGAVIRTEPRWGAAELATVAEGYLVDTVRQVDAAWVQIAYADGDVSVQGYLSPQAPPGRVHRARDPEQPLPTVVPSGKAASGTCLYARARGEAIGYIVGDRDVELRDQGGGWWSLAIDTPWGPVEFAARGPSRADLAACAPPGSVPPPAGAPPPGGPPPPTP